MSLASGFCACSDLPWEMSYFRVVFLLFDLFWSRLYVVALSPSTVWNIHGFNTSQTSLFVDWRNIPGDLQANFFILSLNQTRPQFSDKDGRTSSFFRIVDSSNTSIRVPNLPVFSQYIVLVYLVDVNGDIYKSNTIVVQTDEGGKFIIWKMTRFYLKFRIISAAC